MTLDEPRNTIDDLDDLDTSLETRPIDRRSFLTGAAALGLSATAATLLPRSAEAASVRQARVSASPITLTYWRHNFQPEVKLETQIIKEYEALHPNVKITMVVEADTPTLNQNLVVAMAGGGAPDIIFAYNGYFPSYAALDFVQPINYEAAAGVPNAAALVKQFLPGALDGWKYNGQYYGIVSDASSYVMVISPPLFKAAGLDPVADAPKTWEDLAMIGPKLTKFQNGAMVQQGLALPSYAVVMVLVFDAMIHQLGGSVISADGKSATINSPAGEMTLQTLTDFVNKYKMSLLSGKPLQGAGFNTGSSAIIVDVGLWYRGYLQQTAPKIYANGDGLTFLPFPRFASGKNLGGTPYGYAWTVNSRTPNATAAWDFIKFMAAKAELPDISYGDIPPRASLLTNKQVMSNPDTALQLQELASGAKYAAIPDQVANIVYAAVTSTIFDHVPVKTALSQANQQLNALIPTLPYKLSL